MNPFEILVVFLSAFIVGGVVWSLVYAYVNTPKYPNDDGDGSDRINNEWWE